MTLVFRIAVLALLASAAFGQKVTAVASVRIDGRVERVRKINGRWWSEDNRQLRPDKGGSFIWWIDGKRIPEVVFYHHRPVRLASAESLHLYMSPDGARAVLGDPNETFEKIGVWRYYAEDGTALFLRFFHDELGEARYERSEYGVSGRPVASIERELDGQSIFKLLAERAGRAISRPSRTASVPIPAALTPQSEAPRHRIATDLVEQAKEGMTRAELIRVLGEPAFSSRISGGEHEMEKLTYDLDSGGQAVIRLVDAKVVAVQQ